MDYFTLLRLTKEPFSNSPDPEMFFQSPQHQGCLQKLELAVRLRRGLSVVTGDIGTGKSTICRLLLRALATDGDAVRAQLILDPEFTSPSEFLATIIDLFEIEHPETDASEWRMKESVKNFLFSQGVDGGRIPVLVIDEGQKLPGFCIELLREFLNFETNRFKLLQIVIFAQNEFEETLKATPNFADRITTYHHLTPMSLGETKAMIRFRLHQARASDAPEPNFFSHQALLLIHLLTGGSPRKIVMLCSKTILHMLIRNRKRAGAGLVFHAARETTLPLVRSSLKPMLAATAVLFLLVVGWRTSESWRPSRQTAASPPPATASVTHGPAEPPAAATPAPAEVQPPRIPTAALPASPMPDDLGRLTVGNGEILSKMVARVYGRYTHERMQAVLAKNPGLAGTRLVLPGETVVFPRLPLARPQFEQGRHWIEAARFPTLSEADSFLKSAPGKGEALVLAPIREAGGSLAFIVLLERSFASRPEAEEALVRLPAELKTGAVPRVGPPLGQPLF